MSSVCTKNVLWCRQQNVPMLTRCFRSPGGATYMRVVYVTARVKARALLSVVTRDVTSSIVKGPCNKNVTCDRTECRSANCYCTGAKTFRSVGVTCHDIVSYAIARDFCKAHLNNVHASATARNAVPTVDRK